MHNEDLCGRDYHDNPGGDTCHATGQTYAELDFFNIGTHEDDEWKPFLNEGTYLEWMGCNGRSIPEN